MRGFGIALLLLLLISSIFKLGVDACLPDRGSKLLYTAEQLYSPLCKPLQDLDANARRDMHVDNIGSLFTSRHFTELGIFYAFETALIRPTVLYSELPGNRQFLIAGILQIITSALVLAFLWKTLADKLFLRRENKDRDEIAKAVKAPRRRRMTATTKIISLPKTNPENRKD